MHATRARTTRYSNGEQKLVEGINNKLGNALDVFDRARREKIEFAASLTEDERQLIKKLRAERGGK
jgi:hypothetical protein